MATRIDAHRESTLASHLPIPRDDKWDNGVLPDWSIGAGHAGCGLSACFQLLFLLRSINPASNKIQFRPLEQTSSHQPQAVRG